MGNETFTKRVKNAKNDSQIAMGGNLTRVDGVRLKDSEERENGDHHLTALLKTRAERAEGVVHHLVLAEAVRMAVPGRKTIHHRHHHARTSEEANAPSRWMKTEETLEEREGIIREQRREDPEERAEIEQHAGFRRKWCGSVREKAHLERRARKRRSVRLEEPVHIAVRPHTLRSA